MYGENLTPCLLFHTDHLQFGGEDDSYRFVWKAYGLTDDGEVRNPANRWGENLRGLADFEVSAYCNPRDTELKTYGWSADYRNVFSVGLDEAEVMVKHLRRVEKGLKRMEEQFGYVESFGVYVARVAQVIGAKKIGWRTDGRDLPRGFKHWTLSGDRGYHWASDAAEMMRFVDTVVEHLQHREVTA